MRKLLTCAALLLIPAMFVAALARDSVVSRDGTIYLVGVNVAGAEFGRKLPGKRDTDYFYPNSKTIDHFALKGMNVIRLPVRWERLQPALGTDLDFDEMRSIDKVLRHARASRIKVVLDVHNYAAYHRNVIGTADVPIHSFADLWKRLAERYKNDDDVIFGLMNEPKGLPTETWLEAANAAIAAIRSAGARNLVLVPGNGWTGAHSWFSSRYGTPNAITMLGVNDPARNYAYEVHQYLDKDYSGTDPKCKSESVGADALLPFTQWLRKNGARGFLGEFGGGRNAECLAAVDAMLKVIDRNRDVWLGWTYWAAGAWPPRYFTSVQPVSGVDRPQMEVLLRHVPDRSGRAR